MISEALGKTAAKSAAFLTALTVTSTLISFVRNVVLARLLAPEDFGLIALALVLIQGMDALTSVGVEKYLIQKKKIDDVIVGNIWLLNIVRGILLTLLALALCPLYSSLVNNPATMQVLRIIAFVPLVEGLYNPNSILAERAMQFGRITVYETVCAVLNVSIVVFMAWLLRDAEALAWGILLGTFLDNLLAYFFFPPPKIPKFDLSCQLELLSVAKHFAVIAAGTMIMMQGDNLIVGTLEGSEQLGLYVIAYQLAIFPISFLHQIANRIALPVFSSLQLDKFRLRSVLGNVLQVQLATIIPFVITAAFFAHELIVTLYGEAWTESGNVLRALVFVTLGRGLTHICVPYITGTGAFSFASKMKIFETSLFLVSVYIGTKYFGLIGAALGAGTGYMAAGIGRLIFMCWDAGVAFSDAAQYVFRPTIAVLPGVLLAQLVASAAAWHNVIELTAILGIICISYAGCSLLVQKELLDVFIRKILHAN
ncbi:MAG: oligosaccharide flippase family protein [Candidatus Electrothrix sp. YB6]